MITAEMLRETADKLGAYWQHDRNRRGEEIFMCEAFKYRVIPNYPIEWLYEFENLITEAGVRTLTGGLFKIYRETNDFLDDPYYQKNAQPVRFMFLDLLAYMLEDEENGI